jgi:hypothetical protein
MHTCIKFPILKDVLALGSFFHYAEGFTKPEAFDLTLPELNMVGKLKDSLFPQPRLDFYACVQARYIYDNCTYDNWAVD